MSFLAKYLVVSLPQSADAQEYLEQALLGGKFPIFKTQLPDFQVGTLDSLILESEELAKLDGQLQSSVAKTIDILHTVTESSAPQPVQSKNVLQYVESFRWNGSKYNPDRPIPQLVKTIAEEAFALDNDVRGSYQQFQTARSNFLAADRKRNGDLSIRSLHDIVKPEQFVLDSENLITVLVAVPKNLVKDFLNSYETLVQFVIPRSAEQIAADLEFALYTVTLFKKYKQDFINAARDHKWHPRVDFTYSEEALNGLRREFDITKATETKSKNDLVRLARTAYLDIFAAWVHIKFVRAYVELVLRYGLPPQFDHFLVKFQGANTKSVDAAKKALVQKYGYLGGDGFSKKSNLADYAALVDTEYEPFVLYELEVI